MNGILRKVRLPTGLRGRLLLAFAGISGFAVAAAVTGFVAFIISGQALDEMNRARVPRALDAMELLRDSERFVASGPGLLNAENAEEIGNEIAAKNAELAAIRRLLTDLEATDELSPVVREIQVTIDSSAEILTISARRQQRAQATSYRTALLRNAYGGARALPKSGRRGLQRCKSKSWRWSVPPHNKKPTRSGSTRSIKR